MTFLNPIALIGLAAASIPIILHLLNLRKLKTIEFSTLRFLKELQKTKIRRFKIRQIILLILRTLIIISVVIAFSRPSIERNLPLMGQYAKTSAVIILDNSYSMDFSDELGNRLNQARKAGISVLNALKEGDEATILQMTEPDKINAGDFTRNFSMLKEDISKINLNFTPAKLVESLRIAEQLLENSNFANKEIYVITDAQNNIFHNELKDSIKLLNLSSTLYFIPIGINSGLDNENISVDSLNIVTKIFQINKPVEVEAFLRNNSKKTINSLVVSLFFNDQRVAQRNIDLQPDELKNITISASPQISGVYNARIEIEADALDIDNKRYFGFIIQEKPLVAIFGTQENTKYLSYALSGSLAIEAPAKVDEYSQSEIGSTNLQNYDLVIFSGAKYSENDFSNLNQYIKSGGNAIIFANDETDKTIFKNSISSLGFGMTKEASYGQNNPVGFTNIDRMHPLFQGVFKGTTDSKQIVESPRIEKAIMVDGGQSIIHMSGGIFLSESRLGDGKVFYFAVSPDLKWSNFTLTGLFPTIIYRSVFYLSSKEKQGIDIATNSSLILTLPKNLANENSVKITDPNKIEFYHQTVDLPTGKSISLNNLKKIGNYIVSNSSGKSFYIISVNPDNRESLVDKPDESDIEKKLKTFLSDNVKIEFIDNSEKIANNIERARTGTELWQFFIFLALLLAVAEMIVAANLKAALSDVPIE